VIIGEPPDWYNGIKIAAADYSGRKQYSIYRKLLTYIESDICETRFMFWNDDHFLLRPTNEFDIAQYHNGHLENEFNRNLTGRYYQAVLRTINLLNSSGNNNPLNYDIHCPCIFGSKKFKELFSSQQDELCMKSFYFNNQKEGRSEYMDDLKINDSISPEAINNLIKDRWVFSTGPNGLSKNMLLVLSSLYPKKSKYEK
jgi:hypothetical protein